MLFLKIKRDNTLKAGLVADGSMQERSTASENSSPTVATESLFALAAMFASEKGSYQRYRRGVSSRQDEKTLRPVTFQNYSELISSSSCSSIKSQQNRCNKKRNSRAKGKQPFLRPRLTEATQKILPSSRLAFTWLTLVSPRSS